MTDRPMMDRRAFLKSGSIALFSIGCGPTFLQRAVLAAGEPSPRRRKVLVTIFLRGAMDGLAAVPPLDDRSLKRLRPRLAMSAAKSAGEAALLDLGNGFGLHPSFNELLPLWNDKDMAIVHAVGSPDPTRSHFDAQDYMETGTPGRKGTPDGWLNRVAGLLGHDATPFRAVSISQALPRSLYGDEPALAVSDLREFDVRLPGANRVAEVAGQGFEALYEQTSQDILRSTAQDTFEAVERLRQLDPGRYRPTPGSRYPGSPLGRSLRQIAFMIKSDLGLEIAFAESGGWDTHVRQGAAQGSFAGRARDLSRSIAAFWRDLGNWRDDVVILTMTEFGRTVKENGSGGTDHGHGSCLFAIGSNIDGGQLHGHFPGLDPDVLYEGRDLPVTTDFRAVFAEIAGRQFNLKDPTQLFPGWRGDRLSLWQRS